MADGIPKDYSKVFCEGSCPNSSHSNNSHHLHNNSNGINIINGSSSSSSSNRNGELQRSSLSPKLPPVPSSRGHHQRTSYNTTTTSNNNNKHLDGSFATPKHNEMHDSKSVCLRQVVAKLNNLPKQYHDAYVQDTLDKHYSVFAERRKTSYKAYIQYFEEKDTYVVRVSQNTLRAVKDKMPKRGNYRYFFKVLENTSEEVEFDDSVVPFLEKDGLKQIYCQVFPF